MKLAIRNRSFIKQWAPVLGCAIAALISVHSAHADTEITKEKFLTIEPLEQVAQDSAILTPRSTVSITLSDDESTVEANYSINTINNFVFNTGISAPWNKQDEIGNVGTSSGFANAVTFKLGVARQFWPDILPDDSVTNLCDALEVSLAEKAADTNLSKEDKEKIVKAQNDVLLCDLQTLKKYIADSTLSPSFELEELENRWRKAFGLDKRLFGFAFDASYSNPSFTYLDSETLEKGTDRVDDFRLKASFNVFSPGRESLFEISAEQSVSHSVTAAQICNPIGETGSLNCGATFFGPVEKSESLFLGLRYSKQLEGSAFSFIVRQDIDNEETYVSIPFWLKSAAGSKNLRPGIRFDWDTDEKQASAVLFFGIFNLL